MSDIYVPQWTGDNEQDRENRAIALALSQVNQIPLWNKEPERIPYGKLFATAPGAWDPGQGAGLYYCDYAGFYIRLDIHVDQPVYEYLKVTNILNITTIPTWTPVVSLTATGLAAGVYEVGVSMQGNMGGANKQAYARFQVDGAGWREFSREAKDIYTFTIYYASPAPLTAGDHTVEVEAAKESGGQQFDIYVTDVWFERKL